MVNFALFIKADLENVAEFTPEEHASWTLDLKESGGSEERNGVVVSDEEEHEMPGGTGKAHLVVRATPESPSAYEHHRRTHHPTVVYFLQGRTTVQSQRR